jgi:hypothetical protein
MQIKEVKPLKPIEEITKQVISMSSFDAFVKRVLDSSKVGKLGKDDASRLKRMLENTKRRNIVLAKGILSALMVGKASDRDITSFAKMLETANERIATDKKPFTKDDEKELNRLFKNAGVSEKAARWFALQMDEFLNSEIEEAVMAKKTVAFQPKNIKVDFKKKEMER